MTLIIYPSILLFSYLLLFDQDSILDYITNSSFLRILAIVFLVVGLVGFTLGVIDVYNLNFKSQREFKPRLAIVLFVLVLQFLLLLALAHFASSQATLVKSVSSPIDRGGISNDPFQGVERVNVLVLGGDAGPGRTGLRPDSISIFSIDTNSGQVTIIGVPRNLQNAIFSDGSPLYEPFPNGYNCGSSCLISYLYTFGSENPSLYSTDAFKGRDPGVEATREAVQGVTGLDIPYSVLIDMRGFQTLVDSVGGIRVCIPVSTATRDKTKVFLKGCQYMDGSDALAYSRIRSDSDDYNRMTKQRVVQQALLEQISPLSLILGFQEISLSASSFVKSDIPESAMGDFLRLALKARKFQPQILELVPPLIDVTNPDFQEMRQLIKLSTSSLN